MPATITPTTPSSGTYTIQGSARAIVDLSLPLTIFDSKIVTVRFPTATPPQIVLQGDPPPAGDPQELDLLPAPPPDETTFTGRRITPVVNPIDATVSELACEISVAGGGAAGTDHWTLRIEGLGGHDCVVGQTNNPGQATIRRVICDPVAAFTIGPPPGTATAQEKTSVALTASAAIGANVVKQIGEPDPVAVYRWTHDSDLAITDLPRCGPQTFSVTMPGVYGPETFNIRLDVDFDGSCSPSTVGFLSGSAQQPLTVTPRPQRTILVLDRSGSMFGQKWTNAVTGGRILVQLFAALRSGSGAADQIGIICFEDTTCSWHAGPSPGTAVTLPLTTPASANTQICGLDLGNPGSCTSIGEALVRAMDLFSAGIADDPKLTILLLTDGIENAGPVVVGPAPPGGLPAGTTSFAAARAERAAVNNRLSLYTVGIGSFTQEDVLNALAVDTAYQHVTDVDQLSGALAQAVSLSLEAREVHPEPPSGATTRSFLLEERISRLAVAVEWSSAADTLHLRRLLPDGTTWQEEGTVQKCPEHGFVAVDVASLYGGASSVPATTWQLTHESGGVPQPIADSDVMMFVDLHATGDVVFDRLEYGTGEHMTITARLRQANKGISDATVKVEAAGPGESLGTLLAAGAPQVVATIAGGTVATTHATHGRATSHSADPHAPKARVLSAILGQRGWEELPVWVPPAIFVDGTNELHEDSDHPDGLGNYTNVFAQTSREGSYTFRFTIEATLPGGDPYRQVLTLSKWVGVRADPFDSIVDLVLLGSLNGKQRAQITVTPKDRGGQFLGPFREDAVVFNTTVGSFVSPDDGRAPLPGYSKVDNLDGSYTKILEYPKGDVPIVTVDVGGVALAPTVVSGGCLGWLLGPLLRFVAWIVRRLRS